jgi:uncharacterized protein YkwD
MHHRLVVASLFVLLGAGPSHADTPAPSHADTPAPRYTGLAIQTWFEENHLPGILPDPGLARVARKNSSALAEVGSSVPEGSQAYLRFLLDRHQVRDAVIQAKAFHYRTLTDLKQGIWSFLEQHAAGGGFTHFGLGFGTAPGGRIMTLILVRRRVHVTRVRAVVGRQLELCARLRSGYNPRILVTTPDGRVIQHNPLLRRHQRRFCSRVGAGLLPGRYQVELMVEAPFGPEVASLFPLYVGVSPPRQPVRKLYPPIQARRSAVERRLLRLLDASRRAAHLPPLRPSARLAAVARSHSRDMRRRGFFGHRSPRYGDLGRRLSRAGLSYGYASENLVLSTGPDKAHDSLMNSPGHRRNILDPRPTLVGIGVALDQARGLYYVTQCFARD